MTWRVVVLRRAERDLVEIARYHARDAPATADRILDALLDAVDSLAHHAHRGATPRDRRLRTLGYRYLVVGQHLVFYKALRSVVRVYRVVHGKRAYDGWL